MTTSDKTYIIAEKVGYADPNYFSYAFKKQYSIVNRLSIVTAKQLITKDRRISGKDQRIINP